MELPELAEALTKLGCPAEKAVAMAAQLDRKARMDAGRRGTSYELALQHLVELMAQGWAMKTPKNFQNKSCNNFANS